MPRRKNSRTKGRSKSRYRRGKAVDAVAVQVSVILTRKLKPEYKLNKSVLTQAVLRKAEGSDGVWRGGEVIGAEEGPDPPGMKLKIIRWKNPGRRGGKAGWRTGTQADAWGSLRGLLRGAKISFR